MTIGAQVQYKNTGNLAFYVGKKPGFLSIRAYVLNYQLYHVRSITLILVGAGSPIIFAPNGQSHKPAPAYVLWAIDQT
ncbi:hypothetical protein [Microcoleus sp. B9-D4]|uniref:hypothetical protein n=1 Tax=Microcoleus sp. B9-D4 TaxID=2818711 RepID=UPI002FD56ECF